MDGTALVNQMRLLGAGLPARHNAAVGLACAYLVAVLIVGSHVPREWPPSPRESVRVSQSYAALGQWMVEHVVKPEAVAFQTPYLYPDLQLYWLLGHDELFVNIPLFQDFRQVDAYAAKRGARYLVIAKGTSFDMRRFIFEPYAVKGSGPLGFALPGWHPVAEDPSGDRGWIVYESIAQAAADTRALDEPTRNVSRSTLPTRASVPPG